MDQREDWSDFQAWLDQHFPDGGGEWEDKHVEALWLEIRKLRTQLASISVDVNDAPRP